MTIWSQYQIGALLLVFGSPHLLQAAPELILSSPAASDSSLVASIMAVNVNDGALPELLQMSHHFTASMEECRAALLQLGCMVYTASADCDEII